MTFCFSFCLQNVDENNSGEITFSAYLSLISRTKSERSQDGEDDIVSAYVACGGASDKSGYVNRYFY